MRTAAYDAHDDTVLDLFVPASTRSGRTVVLIHGGFWRERYRRDLMAPLVPSLLAAGHVVANLEYRRVGGGGGWPTTLTDVARGIDLLATVDDVDPSSVVTVGHSAGGHLAVWAAARHRLPATAPGAVPLVGPVMAVAQGGVVLLGEAAAAGLGDGAVAAFLGHTTPERLAVADPSRLLPIGVPVLLVHGERDDDVPISQSIGWRERAIAAGDRAVLRRYAGVGHMELIDPDHPAWADVLAAIAGAGGRSQ